MRMNGMRHLPQARTRQWRTILGSNIPLLAAVLVTAASVSCADVRTTAPLASAEGARSSRSTSSADTARANMVWADSVNIAAPGAAPNVVGAGIRGDGRDKFGQAATFSEYQGSYCGVYGVISSTGGLNVDTDVGYTSSMATACGSSRLYRFYYDGATTPSYSFGPHHWVLSLFTLAVGQSVTQAIFYGVQQTNCQRLYYSDAYTPANNALITRLPDVAGAVGPVRQWRVQSQGSHRAMCVNTANGGKLVSSGVSHLLPFSYTLTEVPPPYPVYP